jgi:hypothetical protein
VLFLLLGELLFASTTPPGKTGQVHAGESSLFNLFLQSDRQFVEKAEQRTPVTTQGRLLTVHVPATKQDNFGHDQRYFTASPGGIKKGGQVLNLHRPRRSLLPFVTENSTNQPPSRRPTQGPNLNVLHLNGTSKFSCG